VEDNFGRSNKSGGGGGGGGSSIYHDPPKTGSFINISTLITIFHFCAQNA